MLLKAGYIKEALEYCCSVGKYLHKSEDAEYSDLTALKKVRLYFLLSALYYIKTLCTSDMVFICDSWVLSTMLMFVGV